MAILRLAQVIARPLEQVFDTVVDVANFPQWNPTTRSARKLTDGPVGNGTMFELEIRGFGKVQQELQEFERNRSVRLVPHTKILAGGHRFRFKAVGTDTRIDHELEMIPKGIFRVFSVFMPMIGKKNLRDTAAALKAHLERP